MKKYILVISLFLTSKFILGQNKSETSLFENDDIKIILLCNDTASIDQPDWIKLIVKNKTKDTISIKESNYSIDKKVFSKNGSFYMNHGDYGQSNYIFNEFNSPKSILPNSELVTYSYITNYASVLLDKNNKLCVSFSLSLTYLLNGKLNKVSNTNNEFCFFWKGISTVPSSNLVLRLKGLLLDSTLCNSEPYIIKYLINIPDIVNQISTDDLINAIVLRENENFENDKILCLNELKKRNIIQNERLTNFYYKKLLDKKSYVTNELIFYWDNSFLDGLLKRDVTIYLTGQILESNSNFWASIDENKSKVYDYLFKKVNFKEELPTNENFEMWSWYLKLMSISRDKRIIDYLVKLLDNESEFSITDQSTIIYTGAYTTHSIFKPDSIKVRICDVAFVSLLRAIGQTNIKHFVRNDGTFFNLTFNEEFIEKQSITNEKPFLKELKFDLLNAEKLTKLTPKSKTKLINYIKSIY